MTQKATRPAEPITASRGAKPKRAVPKRLSHDWLETLAPEKNRFEVSDHAVPGLQLRVEPTGTKHWQLRYYWHSKRQKLALGTWPRGRETGMSLAEARTEAIKARELLDAGIDPRRAERSKRSGIRGVNLPPTRHAAPSPGAEPAGGTSVFETALEQPALVAALNDPLSVAKLAHEYVTGYARKQRKRPEYVERFLVADVLPRWGTRDARTITPREVVELLDCIVARGSPTMANRGSGMLSQMFRYGIHRAIVEASPVQLLYRPGGKEEPRERALSEAELGAFLANLEGSLLDRDGARRVAHVVRLLLLTGQRRGELALARWRDVTLDGKEPTWQIPAEHSKTGAPHTVPLSPAAVAEFRELKKLAGSSAYVVPTADGKAAADPKLITRSVSRNLKRFQLAAAKCAPPVTLEPFTVHDLRRTCRTGLGRLKLPHDVAERLLNHKLPAMREVYDQHESLEEMRAALVKWAKHLAQLEATAEIKP